MESNFKRIERIKEKLGKLKQEDAALQVFGASSHLYELNPVKEEKELLAFEKKYNIRLPEGYRDFLLHIGNGGAGPYYGLQKLEDGLYDDLDRKEEDCLIDPSVEFPHTEPWNMEFPDNGTDEEYSTRDEIYFSTKWTSGVLRICNFGCGIFINLVVKGQEYEYIWVDDRCSNNGIYPDHYFGNNEKIDFLSWYELWLDQSLKKAADNPSPNKKSGLGHSSNKMNDSAPPDNSKEWPDKRTDKPELQGKRKWWQKFFR